MDTHLLSAQLMALINIKVCGTLLWLPIQRMASLNTPGKPKIAWRTVSRLMDLGLVVSDDENKRAVLTTAGEKAVRPHRAALAATDLRHRQALARADLVQASS
ncbi:MAG: hypothetical protein H7248_05590 [Microbacteriaceae bacterium]|nr:hypothetical protein [Microbacteriaceae bacterium]